MQTERSFSFLSIIITYCNNAREKKIGQKKCSFFFLNIKGDSDLPTRVVIILEKKKKTTIGRGWIFTDHRWCNNEKKDFILAADVVLSPNLHWTVADFFVEKRSIEAVFGVVASHILVAIWRARGPQSRQKCTTTTFYSSSCLCFHWL